MNNHITATGTATGKFENHVFKYRNKSKHVAKEPFLKFMLLLQLKMKINYYVMNLTYINGILYNELLIV